jgi:hypothetical protein
MKSGSQVLSGVLTEPVTCSKKQLMLAFNGSAR